MVIRSLLVCMATMAVLAASGCGGGKDDSRPFFEMVHSDVLEVASQLEDLLDIDEVRVNESCQNHGSGPIPPMTVVKLRPRRSVSETMIEELARLALADLGYTVVEDEEPAHLDGRRTVGILTASRDVEGGRALVIDLSKTTRADRSTDFALATNLLPRVTC